jgi:hypothetical protein
MWVGGGFSRGIFVGDAASMAEWGAQQLIEGHGGGKGLVSLYLACPKIRRGFALNV